MSENNALKCNTCKLRPAIRDGLDICNECLTEMVKDDLMVWETEFAQRLLHEAIMAKSYSRHPEGIKSHHVVKDFADHVRTASTEFSPIYGKRFLCVDAGKLNAFLQVME